MQVMDRVLFRDSRAWVCSRAAGEVFEVAVGTGLNLPHYPAGMRVRGIDLSRAMVELARARALELGGDIEVRVGDAEHLDLPDGSVDSVVCTFSLCGIPDHRRALAEMVRVLRPGGLLLLADHVASTVAPVRAVQWLTDLASVRFMGEHFRRRPADLLPQLGLDIVEIERFAGGVVERLAARKPA
ncbi:class I SAM-dependent methyltransferase [Pseudonocardia sp. TRM90224]|uniref:class I SAM-dependent methyltransferase n=1 Tax=Pseudonocardia sp. TRM90224 TaxID=2812678 RepID=UPI001E43C6BF|nr:class I SAM-dependent methyltransferase [Pseudonocardia sp. TRM90224]